MTVDSPRDVRELKPDSSQYRSWVARVDPVLVPLVVVLIVAAAGAGVAGGASGQAALGLFGLVALGVVLGLGGALLSMRTSRIRLGPGYVEHRSWWVRRTVLQTADGVEGLLADYLPAFSGRSSDLLVMRATGGGRRIRLNGAYWTQADLLEIAAHAGVAVVDDPLRAAGFEKRIPGIMYFRERRVAAFLTLFVVGVLVVGVAAVLGVFALAGVPPFDAQPPREVSASTIEQQDGVVDDVVMVLGGTWAEAEVDFDTCTGADDYKGWTRSVQVSPTGGEVASTLTPDLQEKLRVDLANRGYAKVSFDGIADITASSDKAAFDDERVVEVDIDGDSSTVAVTSGCESSLR